MKMILTSAIAAVFLASVSCVEAAPTPGPIFNVSETSQLVYNKDDRSVRIIDGIVDTMKFTKEGDRSYKLKDIAVSTDSRFDRFLKVEGDKVTAFDGFGNSFPGTYHDEDNDWVELVLTSSTYHCGFNLDNKGFHGCVQFAPLNRPNDRRTDIRFSDDKFGAAVTFNRDFTDTLYTWMAMLFLHDVNTT